MIEINLNNTSEIKAMPIKSLKLYFGTYGTSDYTELEFSGANLMKESNIINEQITGKNMRGADGVLYWKCNVTIYYITNDETAHVWLSTASKLPKIDSRIALGSTGAYEAEGHGEMVFGGNSALTLKFKRETTQGFYRYVITLSGFLRDLPTLIT